MKNRRFRVNLALTQEEYDLLQRMSKIQNRSMASIVVELFQQVMPVQLRIAELSELLMEARRQTLTNVSSAASEIEAELREALDRARDQIDLFTDHNMSWSLHHRPSAAPRADFSPSSARSEGSNAKAKDGRPAGSRASSATARTPGGTRSRARLKPERRDTRARKRPTRAR